jgi:hypothetical protein
LFATGTVGQAFSLDGVDDHVNAGSNASLQFGSGAFTIELWVKPTTVGGFRWLVARHNFDDNNGFRFGITSTNFLWFRDRNTGANTFGSPISAGVWTHVAVVRSGTGVNQLQLYQDGALTGTGTSAGNFTPADPFLIGRPAHFSIDFFHGLLDEVSVYNRALSASEIGAIFAAGSAGKCKVPVVANAGSDQTVDESASVTLDGSASTGAGLSYSWTQLAGPSVSLAGDNTATPMFDAPLLPGGFGSQTLTFQLTVTSGSQSSSDIVDVTISNVNHAPVADAGGDQTVNEGTVGVALSGIASYDPDNDPLGYEWTQTGGTPVTLTGATTATPTFTAPIVTGGVGSAETLTFELTVSDGALTHSETVVVTVEQVNHQPGANPGPPQTVHSGSPVTLDGSASGDPDGDPIGFAWLQVGGPSVALANADTANPSFTAPPVSGAETLTFRLTVDDGDLYDEADVAVTVTNGVPRCELALPSPRLLWPPNHGLRQVSITNVTDPNADGVTITVTEVTQDEPVNGLGDGDTSPDAVIQGAGVLLRAERAGSGNGRVYRVSFTADDGQGGVCDGAVEIGVPKSMKPGQGPIESGQAYDSTQP